MQVNEIRIKGKLMGRIYTHPDGRQDLRDAKGVLKAYYDPHRKATCDGAGRYMANGNIINSLIYFVIEGK